MRAPAVRPPITLLASAFVVAAVFEPAAGQSFESLPIHLPDGIRASVPVVRHRDYPAVPAAALIPLGWTVVLGADRVEAVLRHPAGVEISLAAGSPFIRWSGELVQLMHSPYWFGDTLYLPLQLLADIFPAGMPETYSFDPEDRVLEVAGPFGGPAPAAQPAGGPPAPGAAAAGPNPPVPPAVPDGPRAPRVVIVDPGHGGSDPGAVGEGGLREKDVALAIALALARELAQDSDIEVRLTRDRDVDVPLLTRGEWATEWKGDRPGVFISLHANALTDREGVRGFETYFLSEARDESERRVAALENAPLAALSSAMDVGSGAQDPLLGSILMDLAAFDHPRWSADLARRVQQELGGFHLGTDRGVKQGPFAVITSAVMPSVLVEIGFVTNLEEERLLSRPEFHRDAAQALARAVREFFGGYPPGPAD